MPEPTRLNGPTLIPQGSHFPNGLTVEGSAPPAPSGVKLYTRYTVLTPAQLAEHTKTTIAEVEGAVHGADLSLLVNEQLLLTRKGSEHKAMVGEIEKVKSERLLKIRTLPILRAQYERELAAIPKEEEPEDAETEAAAEPDSADGETESLTFAESDGD